MSGETSNLTTGLVVAPIALIHVNPISLRSVQTKSEKFAGLVESIREAGIINPPAARVKTTEILDDEDNPTGEFETYYELIDGLHRFTAAQQVGLDEIPLNVVEMEDKDVLIAQLMANMHKVETTPSQYSQQLRRMLDLDPTLTEAELAQMNAVSTAFIRQRLGLLKIEDAEILELIDSGEMQLGNAYALANLPPDEMTNWVDRALTEKAETFVPAVQARINDIKKERRAGNSAEEAVFTPAPHLRKLRELKEAAADLDVASALADGIPDDCSLAEAIQLGIKFAIHLDPASIAEAKEKFDEQQAAKADKKAKAEARKKAKKLDELKKKQEEAAKKAAEAEAEANKAAEDAGVDLDDLREEALAEADAIDAEGHAPEVEE